MNKKLIALAVAGATFAPAVMAQSANPVTLYGRAWVMVNTVQADGGAAGSALPSRTSVVNESSMFGIRGTEDLGGGLKAFFQFEVGYAPEENATSVSALSPPPATTPLSINNTPVAGRNSGVGLQGAFGTFLAGRWDSPFKLSAIFVDPFGQNTIGNQLSIINTSDFNRREINSIHYWSPTIAGFSARLMYGADEGRANARAAVAANATTGAPAIPAAAASNPSSTSYYIDYATGPVRINFSQERHHDYVGAVITGGTTQKGSNLSGTFTFGPVKLGLETQKIETPGLTDKKASFGAVTYTAGNHVLMATYGRLKNGAAATAAVQPESKQTGIGYDYNFSKRTTFNARYAALKNNAAATTAMNAAGLPGFTAGNDPRGFGVGLRHTF